MRTHICIFRSITSTIIAVGKLSIHSPAFSSRFQYVQWIVIFFGSAFRARSKVYDAVMKRPVKRTSSVHKRYIKKHENSITEKSIQGGVRS